VDTFSVREVLAFKLLRAEIAQRGVEALAVVPDLNVLEDRDPREPVIGSLEQRFRGAE